MKNQRMLLSIVSVFAFGSFFYGTDSQNSGSSREGNGGNSAQAANTAPNTNSVLGGNTEAPNTNTDPQTPPPQREYVPETCAQLSHQFGPRATLSDLQQDELWRQYDGRWARWTVRANDIRESFGTLSMQFKCSRESMIFDGTARFDDDQRAQLLQVAQGSSVVVEGRLADHGRLLGLTLEHCSIH